ncbi:serine hydrolase [Vibrio sp. HN007]|uniref:serine hydrolase n=1 Tax=Vibrio iocasae TaxID=3098914 RepID=UPI0035D4EA65
MLRSTELKKIALKGTTTITDEALLPWSPITAKYVGKELSLMKMREAIMAKSDNTAVNSVLEGLPI